MSKLTVQPTLQQEPPTLFYMNSTDPFLDLRSLLSGTVGWVIWPKLQYRKRLEPAPYIVRLLYVCGHVLLVCWLRSMHVINYVALCTGGCALKQDGGDCSDEYKNSKTGERDLLLNSGINYPSAAYELKAPSDDYVSILFMKPAHHHKGRALNREGYSRKPPVHLCLTDRQNEWRVLLCPHRGNWIASELSSSVWQKKHCKSLPLGYY